MTSTLTDRRRGINSGIAIKVPCRAASTAALTLSGEQTVDGVALVSGDRCLVKNQASAVNNGIYEVDTGDWSRTPDFDGEDDVKEGTLVKVNGGSTMPGFWYVSTTGSPVPGTDSINFGMASTVLAVVTAFAQTILAAASASAARTILGVPSTTEAILQTIGTTKGDIIGFSAASTSVRKGVGTDGYRLSANSGDTDGLRYLPPGIGHNLVNGYLDWTVAANALTCTLKGLDGNAPSTTNPVFAWIRSSTAATGSPTLAKITAATTANLSSGSTGGTRNAVPFNVWAVLADDASTYRMGLVQCVTTVAGAGAGNDVTNIYALGQFPVVSSTAEGGAGAADSAGVIYSTTAWSAKAYTVLGFAYFAAGQAAAGTWATAPTRQHLYLPGQPLPNQVIQIQRTPNGAFASGTTATPLDDTIPQITEGDQFLSQAITPTSAASILVTRVNAMIGASVANSPVNAIHRDATANALIAWQSRHDGGNTANMQNGEWMGLADSVTATTFKYRVGTTNAGTMYLNGPNGARVFGGVAGSSMSVTELQG